MSTVGLLRSERGIALPAALAVLFMVAGLATVTAKAAITSDHESLRDRNVKQALQAANAGSRRPCTGPT